MIKVLGLALYGPLAASTRYRLGQYVDGLKSHGIDLQIRHMLDDEYLSRRFAGHHIGPAMLLRAGARRIKDLLQQGRFNASIVHCELMPLLPGLVESALLRIPYVYDFDDAFYLKYRIGRLAVLRGLLGSKFDRMMRGAAQVTAGNHVLASYASQHNRNTHYLPTVVDTRRYRPARIARADQTFIVGWIGSPSTAPYLSQLVSPLSELGAEGPVRFIVIGGKSPPIPNVEVVELDWSEQDEVRLINGFDVGVMPLPDTDWARGKCAFKLIQYMACGIPAIGSPVGANLDVLGEDRGRTAATPQEWAQCLRELREQRELRLTLGEAGRAHVERHFSLERNLPVLARAMHTAAGTA